MPSNDSEWRAQPLGVADDGAGHDGMADDVIATVQRWLGQSGAAADRGRRDIEAERLAGLLKDPDGLDFALGFVDRVVRPEDLRVAGRNLDRLVTAGARIPPLVYEGGDPARRRFRAAAAVADRADRARGVPAHRGLPAPGCEPQAAGRVARQAAPLRHPAQPDPARGGRARRRRGRPSAGGDPRAARPPRCRLRVDQGVGDLQPAQPVGLRRDRGSRGGPAHAALRVRRRLEDRQVHQPRHGGVPRPRSHHCRVHATARAAPS